LRFGPCSAASASVSLFGLQNNIGYLDVLSYISRHGEAHLSNHSVNGLLHRLVGNDDGLIWRNDAFSPFHPVVYAGTLVTSAALLLIGLWPRGKLAGMKGLLQFQLAALAFTIASPLAWEPHYGFSRQLLRHCSAKSWECRTDERARLGS
jgi:alpha-1,2-mannosyltransferase